MGDGATELCLWSVTSFLCCLLDLHSTVLNSNVFFGSSMGQFHKFWSRNPICLAVSSFGACMRFDIDYLLTNDLLLSHSLLAAHRG